MWRYLENSSGYFAFFENLSKIFGPNFGIYPSEPRVQYFDGYFARKNRRVQKLSCSRKRHPDRGNVFYFFNHFLALRGHV